MHSPRHIDDLLKNPFFLESHEYRCLQNLVDQGAFPSVKEAILSLSQTVETVRREDWASWPEEINAAIAAEQNGRIFSPMQRVAASILDCVTSGDFTVIPDESWIMLSSFLTGAHRGKKGIKPDTDLFNRQCAADIADAHQQMVANGMKPSKAQEALSVKERLDIRSIQRMLKRERERAERVQLAEEISALDITKFFVPDE